MPTFSSGSFGQLRYGVEVTPGITPAIAGTNLRQTGFTLKAGVATTTSKEVRSDRLSSGQTRTDLNIDGGFNLELSAREYDPFIESLLGATYTHFGVAGLGAAIPTSCTTAATTITAGAATSGASIFTALANGSWFKIVPLVGNALSAAQKLYFADAWFKVASSTATVLTLDASTPIAAVGQGSLGTFIGLSQSSVVNGSSLTRAFTLEYAMTDIAQFLPFQGNRVNSLELNVQVGSIITGSMGFIGQGHSGMVGATTFTGGPIASQTNEVMNAVADVGLMMENGASLLTNGSFIKGVKLNISNNMRAQKAVATFGNAGIGLGELALTGNLELYVADATYYNRWFQGTNTSLAIGFADSAGNGYLVELDKVNFQDGGLNPGDVTSDVMLSLPFKAYYNAATNRGIRITRGVAP